MADLHVKILGSASAKILIQIKLPDRNLTESCEYLCFFHFERRIPFSIREDQYTVERDSVRFERHVARDQVGLLERCSYVRRPHHMFVAIHMHETKRNLMAIGQRERSRVKIEMARRHG